MEQPAQLILASVERSFARILRFSESCFRERQRRLPTATLSCLSLVLVVSQLAACSLTQDQLTAVKSFAAATHDYSSNGGALLTADANVFLSRESFQTAAIDNPDQLWKAANNARGDYERELDLARKFTTAMVPLAIYSQELEQFATTDFTSANDKAAKNLGDNFNKAIDSANKTFGTTLPKQSVGTAVTYSVQYLGYIYIKYRQAQETKLVVDESNGTVKELTTRVKEIAQEIQQDSLEPANDQFRKSLTNLSAVESLEFNWRSSHPRESPRRREVGAAQTLTPDILSPSASTLLLQALIKLDDAQKLAKSLIDASDSCATAHEKMFQALNRPESASEAIAQIESFQTKAKGPASDSTKEVTKPNQNN